MQSCAMEAAFQRGKYFRNAAEPCWNLLNVYTAFDNKQETQIELHTWTNMSIRACTNTQRQFTRQMTHFVAPYKIEIM